MEWLYLMKWSYKKFLYLRLELFRILKRMTAEATFQALRCFADVLSTTTPGFSCNNVYQIWTVSVNVFVDLDAVSFAIDRGCYSWLAWDMVAC